MPEDRLNLICWVTEETLNGFVAPTLLLPVFEIGQEKLAVGEDVAEKDCSLNENSKRNHWSNNSVFSIFYENKSQDCGAQEYNNDWEDSKRHVTDVVHCLRHAFDIHVRAILRHSRCKDCSEEKE